VDPSFEQRLSALMVRAQGGDRQAYRALLEDVERLVRELARRRVPDACDDVVQETMLAVHCARHTYDPSRPFGPWLYAIARHRMADALRREQRRRRLVDSARDAASLGDEPRDHRHDARVLRRALSYLSAQQRSIIEKLKLAEYSVAEVSQQTGLSASAVKVSAHRGYRKLRVLLGGDADE
jgi:RNA polymerase sigma-70 factor (ECF subfamily)